jgi:hypothetical protein
MRQRQFKQLDRPLTSLASSVSWLLNWDMLVNEAENAGQPFPEAEMDMYFENAIAPIKEMVSYRANYDLMDDDSTEKTHHYLGNALERIVSKEAELFKENELLGALNPRLAPPSSAVAAAGGANRSQYCYKFSDHGTGEGGCTKGAACTFSHASEPAADKNARIKRRSEFRSNSRGSGKTSGGKGDSKGRRQSSGPPRERKPKSETPCRFLKTPPGCRDGAKCAYGHTDASPAARAAADNEPVAAAFASIELHESDEEPAVRLVLRRIVGTLYLLTIKQPPFQSCS